MDITFKCPHCDQELEVDAAGAGSSFECPSCGNSVTIPASDSGEATPVEAAAAAATPPAPPPKEEKHYAVPVHEGPTDVLIKKANKPLEVAAKEGDKKVRIRTFKRTDCQEVGRDRFDDVVSEFLDRVGWDNVISVNPINYSYIQLDTHQNVTDYGVLIVYRG